MQGSNLTDQDATATMRVPATRDTNDVDRFVGGRVRFYRAMLGMSQQKLADNIGVTFQQLQKYERGENRIGAGRLLMVAKALGLPITYLLDQEAFARHQTGDALTEAEEMPRDVFNVGRAFSQITDPEIRRSITTLVQSLARESESGRI